MRAYSLIRASSFIGDRSLQKVFRIADKILIEFLLTRICMLAYGSILVVVFSSLLSTGRVAIRGIENLRDLPPKRVLFVANHPSYLDPFLLAMIAAFREAIAEPIHMPGQSSKNGYTRWITLFLIPLGWGLLKVAANPKRLPWQMADERNFREFRLFIIPFRALRCIPVRKNDQGERNDSGAFRLSLGGVKESCVAVFPGGTRDQKAKEAGNLLCTTASGIPIVNPEPGIAGIVQRKTTNVPILFSGVQEVASVGTNIRDWIRNFRQGQRVTVTIGRGEKLYAPEGMKSKEERKWLANTLMYRVADLDPKEEI